MILLNAFYFNGLWKYPFDKNDNYESYFMNYNKEPKEIEFMSFEKNLIIIQTKKSKLYFLNIKMSLYQLLLSCQIKNLI